MSPFLHALLSQTAECGIKIFPAFILILLLQPLGSDAQAPTDLYRKGLRRSLLISSAEALENCDSTWIVDSIQLNGKGSKELIIHRNCSSQLEQHGGSYDISERRLTSRFEVWDPDAKAVLFAAQNCFALYYNRFDMYMQPMQIQGSIHYTYRVSFSRNGDIYIHNLNASADAKPDIQEGCYRYTGEGLRLMPGDK